MRIVLALAAALALSGCADSAFVDHPISSLFPSLGPDQTASAQAVADPHCSKLAKQRAGDASFAGEDTETQRAVYDKTYADCLDWDSKHKS